MIMIGHFQLLTNTFNSLIINLFLSHFLFNVTKITVFMCLFSFITTTYHSFTILNQSCCHAYLLVQIFWLDANCECYLGLYERGLLKSCKIAGIRNIRWVWSNKRPGYIFWKWQICHYLKISYTARWRPYFVNFVIPT